MIRKSNSNRGPLPICYHGQPGPLTDKDGRFRIRGLVPGLTYRCAAFGWKLDWTVGRTNIPYIVAKGGEVIDPGDIVVRLPE